MTLLLFLAKVAFMDPFSSCSFFGNELPTLQVLVPMTKCSTNIILALRKWSVEWSIVEFINLFLISEYLDFTSLSSRNNNIKLGWEGNKHAGPNGFSFILDIWQPRKVLLQEKYCYMHEKDFFCPFLFSQISLLSCVDMPFRRQKLKFAGLEQGNPFLISHFSKMYFH